MNELQLRAFFDERILEVPDRPTPKTVPPVKSVSINHKPGTTAGYAFVEFSSIDDAEIGLCMDGTNLYISSMLLTIRMGLLAMQLYCF